jgi:hypothetical protein
VGDLSQKPKITFDSPGVYANTIFGHASNIDVSKVRVVIYVYTNTWYIEPCYGEFTNICSDGSWSSPTCNSNSSVPWTAIQALLVDPTTYRNTSSPNPDDDPMLAPGVLASTRYQL